MTTGSTIDGLAVTVSAKSARLVGDDREWVSVDGRGTVGWTHYVDAAAAATVRLRWWFALCARDIVIDVVNDKQCGAAGLAFVASCQCPAPPTTIYLAIAQSRADPLFPITSAAV